MFGAPKTSLFGPTPGATAQPNAIGGLGLPQPGATNQGGLFGQNNNQQQQQTNGGGLFGQAPSAPATGGGLFGQPANNNQGGGLFGKSTPQAASTGGLFGGAKAPLSAAPAGGGGLFGAQSSLQPQQQQNTSLFGGARAPQPVQPAGTSLFNPQAGTQPQAAGLFNKPAAQPMQGGGLFGGMGQQQTQPVGVGSFGGLGQGQGMQQQNVLQQQQAMGQNPQQNTQMYLQSQFYKVKGALTGEVLQKIIESQGRIQIQNSNLKSSVSTSNMWRSRCMRDHPKAPQLAQTSEIIDKKLKDQDKQLQEVKTCLNSINKQKIQLEKDISQAVKYLHSLNQSQQSISFQMQGLKVDIFKLIQFRQKLGQAIQFYQTSTDEFQTRIELPSQFFIEMQKHHEKLIQMLQLKIEQAESVASALFEESVKEQNNNGTTEKVDFKQMKIKIFDICKMIYDEQKIAGMQLKQIEYKVTQLRSRFQQIMISKKGYSAQEIENLFIYGQPNDTQIHREVQNGLKKLKHRNQASQLENQLKKMNINTKKDEKSKQKVEKDKLSKGLYSSLNSKDKSSMQYGLWGQSEQLMQTQMIGKRPDPYALMNNSYLKSYDNLNQYQKPYSQYFVKKQQPQDQREAYSVIKKAKYNHSSRELDMPFNSILSQKSNQSNNFMKSTQFTSRSIQMSGSYNRNPLI